MLARLPFFTRHNIEPISFRLHTFLFFYCSFYFFSKKKWLCIRKGALDYHRQTHTSSQHLLLQDVSWLLLIVLVAQVRSNRDERNTQNNHFPFIHPIHQRRSQDEENKRSKVRHSSSSSMSNKNAPCVCSTQVLPPEGSEAFSTVFLKLSFYRETSPLL